MARETLADLRAQRDALTQELADLKSETASLRFLLDAIRALLRET